MAGPEKIITSVTNSCSDYYSIISNIYFSVNVVCASFPQALSYFGGFRKVQIPRVVEQEILQPDGSVIRRFERQAWCLCAY